MKAAVEASVRRCRAVILTSVTTVVGITPVLLETDIQAQFLKPMVISLSFGLLFGTVIVLFLLPAFLTGIETLRQLAVRVRSDFIKLLPDPRTALAAGRIRRMTQTDPTAMPRTEGDQS